MATSRFALAEIGRVFSRLSLLSPQVAAVAAAREALFETDGGLSVIQPVDGATTRDGAGCFRPDPLRQFILMDSMNNRRPPLR